MKELYYVIQTLIHGRGANLIKVISLTLGLTVSILIFAREAFELSLIHISEPTRRIDVSRMPSSA